MCLRAAIPYVEGRRRISIYSEGFWRVKLCPSAKLKDEHTVHAIVWQQCHANVIVACYLSVVNPRSQEQMVESGDWSYDQRPIRADKWHEAIQSAAYVWKAKNPNLKVMFLGQSKVTNWANLIWLCLLSCNFKHVNFFQMIVSSQLRLPSARPKARPVSARPKDGQVPGATSDTASGTKRLSESMDSSLPPPPPPKGPPPKTCCCSYTASIGSFNSFNSFSYNNWWWSRVAKGSSRSCTRNPKGGRRCPEQKEGYLVGISNILFKVSNFFKIINDYGLIVLGCSKFKDV